MQCTQAIRKLDAGMTARATFMKIQAFISIRVCNKGLQGLSRKGLQSISATARLQVYKFDLKPGI